MNKSGLLESCMHLASRQHKSWFCSSVNRRILGAAMLVGALTLLVLLAGMVKEMSIAREFGRSGLIDAFLVAFLIPSFVISVVVGSVQSAFMPTYIHTREKQGADAARQLLASASLLCVGILLGSGVILWFAAPLILPLLGSGFTPDTLALCKNLFYLLLPVLLITGMARFWAVVINAGERFALVAIAPIANPLAVLVCLWLLAKSLGIFALAFGITIGAFIEALMLILVMRRQRLSVLPAWKGMTPALRQVLGQYMPMVVGAGLMCSTSLVDTAMAAMLDPGSVSALNYGRKAPAMITGIASIGLGTAVLPYFSKMVAHNAWLGIRNTLKQYTKLILLLALPLSVGLFYGSEFIVRILFERGAFSTSDTQLVGQVQAFYGLQVPFYILGIFFVRLISSLKANKFLMWGSLLNLILNVVLNYVLMMYLGVSGIALSTSIVYAISMIYLGLVLFKLLKRRTTV